MKLAFLFLASARISSGSVSDQTTRMPTPPPSRPVKIMVIWASSALTSASVGASVTCIFIGRLVAPVFPDDRFAAVLSCFAVIVSVDSEQIQNRHDILISWNLGDHRGGLSGRHGLTSGYGSFGTGKPKKPQSSGHPQPSSMSMTRRSCGLSLK